MSISLAEEGPSPSEQFTINGLFPQAAGENEAPGFFGAKRIDI
jgi:hypothetical protein